MSDAEYVVARRVLLDALHALQEHRQSLILVGAQAVYLRVGETDDLAVAPYTTDGDLAIDPTRLAEIPPVEVSLERADFARAKPDTVGIWSTRRVVITGEPRTFSVDLLVPSSSKHRAARLQGHDRRVARNVDGLEGALVDHDTMTVGALDPDDSRTVELAVAGPAALLVAKVHKIRDRLGTDRSKDKDALDVLRILRGIETGELCDRFRRIRADERSSTAARLGLTQFSEMFTGRRAEGVEMIVRSTQQLGVAEEYAASCVALATDLVASLSQ